ncbi:MAG: transcription-repair coupling factor, partial [Clostridia bacterium]|nr:transcription-repair coupling factor [Clostridia bacterium]
VPSERRIKKRRGDLFLAPEVGDYAVHEKYGVGKITGTKKIETTDGVKEYVALAYQGGDCLYVPVEQMDVLSKYMGGDDPALSKIGGGELERVKARVRASLKKMAFDLKNLYAERQEQKGYVFPEYPEMNEEFAAAFPYEETPDQLTSYEEIKEDMCSPKVMDRLLCGDVGFGKTEVALRAAYLCILAGRQVALMCPSTVLSEQHFRTANERMKDFGVRVASLNRFRSEKEQALILARLEKGEIDLVVGTHRLLSKDVKFRDLGLLILDEEQRFGVEHKEKIKNYKRDVDCLTMTATPIPRTLHLSLSGIRDISTIQTPPHARLPVQTYVAEETETLVRDACVREIARKGQVFVLYNRVESIHAYAKRLTEIVPEARVAVAHGRMDKNELERNVFAFYRGEYDVLVTTTIIENGIDLPNANTLVVIDADRLGISQLYQLRGRVGRGARLAHAYFTYKPERVMTENAAERLKAIMQFTELGSGFKIAMRDLEIRGAGNVLGAEQHGHMDKVGYELYAKILKEELTGERQESVDLDIKATAFIPERYVESNAGRMDCYKQIAEIRSAADYKRVCVSMEEQYGPLPPETLNLLVIAVMKSYAAKFRVRKISVDKKGGALEFVSLDALNNRKISAAMEKFGLY